MTAQLLFDVDAVDEPTAHSKLFDALMSLFASAKEKGIVWVRNPYFSHNLPYLNGYRLTLPPPQEYSAKSACRIPVDIQYFPVIAVGSVPYSSWEESTRWIVPLFQEASLPDIRLVGIEESGVAWS